MTTTTAPRAFPPLTLLMLSLAQFAAAGFARLTGHGQDIAAIAGRDGVRPPEVPAGYAFSIWFAIFTLSVVYSIYYATKGQNHDLCRRVSWPAAVLFICSSLWMIGAQTIGSGWHLVTLALIMWAASTRALLTVRYASTGDNAQRLILQPLFGLCTGWLTAALFLNTTATFAKEIGTFGLAPNLYALFTLVPAAILAVTLTFRTKGEPYLFAAFQWALAAIVVANLQAVPANTEIVPLIGGLSSVLILVFAWVRLRKAR